MNTVDRMYPRAAAFLAAVVLLGSSCTSDWGKVDPPAGIQTAPNLENVATFEFEEDMLDPLILRAYGSQEQIPSIVEDELKGKVLELNDGWVEMNNPLNNVNCEKAASLTFWMKQIPAVSTDEDGNEVTEPQDIASPLFMFTNQNRVETLTFSANGGIEYDAADGTWSCDNPADVTTGYIPVDGFDGNGWNYVALTVRDNGYDLFVNGQKKASTAVTDFDCSRLVAFMNHVSVFSVGSADNHGHWLIDDLKLYRNALTVKETARPRVSWENGGSEGPVVDLSKWIMVGLEDNSTGFWTEFSPYFSLAGDGQIHYEFYNYTRKINNWDNWLLVLATAERGGDGYVEHAVIRADNFGWATRYDAGDVTSSCDFNFDTFKEDMDGALVNITIDRAGTDVDVTAVVTTAAGTVYNYKVSIANVPEGNMTTWLLCEGSHLLLNPEGCFIGTLYPDHLKVGPEDNSAPWWSIWSPNNLLKGDFSGFGFDFINHNSGTGGNWNNWVLVCTNGKYIGEDGYAENFVLRSDAYGWGAGWDAGTVTASFNWDTYVADMHDAHSRIYVERSGNDLLIVARQTMASGTAFPEYRFETTVEGPEIGLFFVLDANWLEFTKVGYFPLVSMNPEN